MLSLRHLHNAGSWLIAAIYLTSSFVAAQPARSPVSSADAARQRVEIAAQRRRNAVKEMDQSIAAQQRSVARRHVTSPADGFAVFNSRLESLAPQVTCDSLPSNEIDSLVDAAAAGTSVSPEPIRAVMRQESDFRPCAVSSKGAMGLMQSIPGTADSLGVEDAFDPEQNVLGGARLLKQLMDRYSGDLNMTLSTYNAGVRPVDAAMGIPMIPETTDYVSRILKRLSSSPNQAVPGDPHSVRDSAPDTSFRLTGSDSGK